MSLFILFLYLPLIITGSKIGCSFDQTLNFSTNLNETMLSIQKSKCINDETCCFLDVKYMKEVGGYHVSTCFPLDYDKNTSSYNFSEWKQLALNFCADSRLLINSKYPIDYINECQCGYYDSYDVYLMSLIKISLLVIYILFFI